MPTKQTLILDSSQLSTYYECPEMWNLISRQHLIKIDPSIGLEAAMRPSEAIAAGTLGHKYQEIYYHCLGVGYSPEAAIEESLKLDPSLEDKVDSQFPLDPDLCLKVKNRFIDYIMRYSHDDFTIATRQKYHIAAVDGKLVDTTISDPLVEKGFSYKLFESPEYLFILEGRIDFMAIAKDGITLFWGDNKWQFREHELYSKCIQFKNYSLATGLNVGLINYIRLHDKLSPRTFVRQPISFSSREMLYWKQELTEKYIEIAKAIKDNKFPNNWSSCGGHWGKHCMFVPLCEERNEMIREQIKEQQFTKRKEWRPW